MLRRDGEYKITLFEYSILMVKLTEDFKYGVKTWKRVKISSFNE